MNILLEKSKFIKHYGYMNDIFGVLDGVCEEYDWYISNIELNCTPLKELPQKQQFIKGELLKRIEFKLLILSAFAISLILIQMFIVSLKLIISEL